ncbi:MAG: hypothetical protein MO846_01820 [Candidatus Devosia symbiotica]|nr:hypothetical protein [Candidatus Devosia symbiotica]
MVFSNKGVRALFLLALSALCIVLDVDLAYVQSSQCVRLDSALRQFDRNGDFCQMGSNSQAARQAQRDVQSIESRYVRDGVQMTQPRPADS